MFAPKSTTPSAKLRRAALAITGIALLSFPSISRALPSFARQMDMQCSACHTDFPALDGTGRSASDNNTLYLEAWIVF